MRLSRHLLAAFAPVLIAAAPAVHGVEAPKVQVEYVHPENFADVGDGFRGGDAARSAYLEALNRHLQARAARVLGNGQSLKVSITEVDMAGEFEPWRIAGADVRIVRNIYPARIDLSFRLADAGGAVVKEGERRLRDTGFTDDVTRYSDDPLRYEKALIDAWVEREFPAPR
ncbi:MAG TPA: DUF3016 domain-containing protein [Burkholderiales bacterium]|nr:DUF3016 domain-containing protein [Burkholderiales bacterium]